MYNLHTILFEILNSLSADTVDFWRAVYKTCTHMFDIGIWIWRTASWFLLAWATSSTELLIPCTNWIVTWWVLVEVWLRWWAVMLINVFCSCFSDFGIFHLIYMKFGVRAYWCIRYEFRCVQARYSWVFEFSVFFVFLVFWLVFLLVV